MKVTTLSRSSAAVDHYWDAAGLAKIAQLLEDFVTNSMSQNALARAISVSPTTLRNIRNNQGGKIISTPDPSTLERLAPYLTNPDTSKPFTSNEIIDLASGAYSSREDIRTYVSAYLARKRQTISDLALSLETSEDELATVLDNPGSLTKDERLTWIIVLGSKLGNVSLISRLMGVQPSLCRDC